MSDMGHAELGCQQDVEGRYLAYSWTSGCWGIQVLARKIHFGAIHKGVAVKAVGLNKLASVVIGEGRRKYFWGIFTLIG